MKTENGNNFVSLFGFFFSAFCFGFTWWFVFTLSLIILSRFSEFEYIWWSVYQAFESRLYSFDCDKTAKLTKHENIALTEATIHISRSINKHRFIFRFICCPNQWWILLDTCRINFPIMCWFWSIFGNMLLYSHFMNFQSNEFVQYYFSVYKNVNWYCISKCPKMEIDFRWNDEFLWQINVIYAHNGERDLMGLKIKMWFNFELTEILCHPNHRNNWAFIWH